MRDKRKQDIVYHEAMKMYMEESKKIKGKSGRAYCEEIGLKYNVLIAVSTVCKKVQVADKVSSGEPTTNLIQLFKPGRKQGFVVRFNDEE